MADKDVMDYVTSTDAFEDFLMDRYDRFVFADELPPCLEDEYLMLEDWYDEFCDYYNMITKLVDYYMQKGGM